MSEHDQEHDYQSGVEPQSKGHDGKGETKAQEKTQPSHSVSFSRIVGRDQYGKDILGPARQIGAIWPRAGKEGDGILRYDHIPEEMRSGRGGVVFTRKLDPERGDGKAKDKDRER